MKQIIRKILKEDATERYVDYIVSDIKKNKIFNSDKAIERYGIDDRLLKILQDTAFAKLHDIKGKTIDTDDNYGGNYGTYSFKFNVYSVLDWRGTHSEIGVDIEFDNEEQAVSLGIFKKALQSPFNTMAQNAGHNPEVLRITMGECEDMEGFNFLTGNKENLFHSGVIDPAKVTRCALKNAVSVAGTLLLTNHSIVH